MTDELRKGELMTIGGLGTYGSLYDVRVNQSTKVKNTASSDFSKTMETASEISSVHSRESAVHPEVHLVPASILF